MLQRLILHIGPPKTGTSSIQAFLRSAQEDLLSDGILYPTNGRLEAGITYRVQRRGKLGSYSGPSSAHYLLAWSLAEAVQELTADECWMKVLDEIQTVNPRIAILSAEAFAWLPEKSIFQARELLADLPVNIVIYFRNQLRWMLSRYNQNVKVGAYRHSFRRFLEDGSPYNYISYERVIKRYIDAFGQENVTIKPFDKIVSKIGLERDLIDMMGLKMEKYAKHIPTQKFNVSVPEERLNVIRFLNLAEHYLVSRRLSKKLIRLTRKSILRNGVVCRKILVTVQPFFNKPLYCDNDVRLLTDIIKDWHPEFLCKYLDPEDHVYFKL